AQYVIKLQFFFQKIRTGAENLTQDSNTLATTTITTTATNADSSLFLSSDPEDLGQMSDEVNFNVESNELNVIHSRPDTNPNDIDYYVLNKLSIDDHLKYSLLTNHFKPDNKYSFPTLYSDDREHSR
ncbi:unnamed protein product, partial [Rotaria sordida]